MLNKLGEQKKEREILLIPLIIAIFGKKKRLGRLIFANTTKTR